MCQDPSPDAHMEDEYDAEPQLQPDARDSADAAPLSFQPAQQWEAAGSPALPSHSHEMQQLQQQAIPSHLPGHYYFLGTDQAPPPQSPLGAQAPGINGHWPFGMPPIPLPHQHFDASGVPPRLPQVGGQQAAPGMAPAHIQAAGSSSFPAIQDSQPFGSVDGSSAGKHKSKPRRKHRASAHHQDQHAEGEDRMPKLQLIPASKRKNRDKDAEPQPLQKYPRPGAAWASDPALAAAADALAAAADALAAAADALAARTVAMRNAQPESSAQAALSNPAGHDTPQQGQPDGSNGADVPKFKFTMMF